MKLCACVSLAGKHVRHQNKLTCTAASEVAEGLGETGSASPGGSQDREAAGEALDYLQLPSQLASWPGGTGGRAGRQAARQTQGEREREREERERERQRERGRERREREAERMRQRERGRERQAERERQRERGREREREAVDWKNMIQPMCLKYVPEETTRHPVIVPSAG